jgi:hypothetical protein
MAVVGVTVGIPVCARVGTHVGGADVGEFEGASVGDLVGLGIGSEVGT